MPKLLQLRNVEVQYRNFRGEMDQYNTTGARTFSVLIDDLDQAEDLLAAGWNLKPMRSPGSDEVDAYHLPIRVRMDGPRPAEVYQVLPISKTRTLLTEETLGMLDHLTIEFVHVDVNPYEWSVSGNSGIKAYCQKMYVSVVEDDMDMSWQRFVEDDEDDFFDM